MGTIGRYALIRELGHGAMGQVFLARDLELDRAVAIKLLHQDTPGRDARGRFRHEARALAALNHPGVVTIFEIGHHEGQDFIAMEYLSGRSLRDVLSSAERPSREELVSICARVAIAVHAAHRAGILHGDIKPENVVITDGGDVKVVDFGLARRHGCDYEGLPPAARVPVPGDAFTTTMAVDVGPTFTRTLYGTPAYMSPELIMEGRTSEASDVYALGVMLYECLAGRRPYDTTSVVELLARVIDGSESIAPVNDPFGDLTAKMLARDPADRPTLPDIAAALEGPRDAVVVRRPWPRWLAPAMAIATTVAGVGAWSILRAHARAEAASQAQIAVASLTIDTPSFGTEPKLSIASSDVLAVMLGEINGIRAVGASELEAEVGSAQDPERRGAARRLGAQYLVRGSISERDGKLYAQLELSSLVDSRPAKTVTVQVDHLDRASLNDQLAQQIARSVGSDKQLDLRPNRQRARRLYAIGSPKLMHSDFYEAELYLDQAVNADPSFFDGWYSLALARGWRFAPQSEVLAAVSSALALASDPRHQALLRGVKLFFDHQFGAARAALDPLEHLPDLTPLETRDVLYYLGESHWHDGHHEQGAKYLLRVLQIDASFKPATIHLVEYAAARRDLELTSRFLGLHEHAERDSIDLVQGHYEELARNGRFPGNLYATLVLDRKPTAAMEADLAKAPTTADIYHAAIALAAGELATARTAIDDFLSRDLPAQPGAELSDGIYFEIALMTDVLLAAGRTDDVRRIVTFLAEQARTQHVYAYHRLSILAAPLVGDPAWIIREGGTEREGHLADAISAEMSGDRALAIKLLSALVADPTASWDYPERAALLRNLLALGRMNEARALCADVLRPPMFRPAFVPLRAQCSSLVPHRASPARLARRARVR
ncbi:MAG TPA: serine/threonine-protein kinase [Kofleriaceae bacterium]|nr:serine/threonine-protein kinase [Kofleriaceae bacterium]